MPTARAASRPSARSAGWKARRSPCRTCSGSRRKASTPKGGWWATSRRPASCRSSSRSCSGGASRPTWTCSWTPELLQITARGSVVHAGLPLEPARDREPDLLSDPVRLRAALAGAPDGQGLVAIAKHPAVPGFVPIDLGIGIGEAELGAQEVQLVGSTGEEQPLCIVDAVHPGILLERGG